MKTADTGFSPVAAARARRGARTLAILGLGLFLAWAPAPADPDEEATDPGLMCISIDEFLALGRVVSEALISDCDTGTPYCVSYAATDEEASPLVPGQEIGVRYSAWVLPDLSQATLEALEELDVERAPVRERELSFVLGRSDLVGLETILRPKQGRSPGVGALVLAAMPAAIAGTLRDGVPPIPAGGGVAARIEVLSISPQSIAPANRPAQD